MNPYRKSHGNLARGLSDLRTVGAFLTILPVGPRIDDRADLTRGDLAAASWCFPVIGLIVGGLAGLAYALAAWLGFNPWLAATLCVTVLVLLCGAMHEDGLGDFADGMGGTSRERRLAIMRDSQAGNFALVALLLLFAARIGALAAIAAPGAVIAALVTAAVVSRTAMVVVMYFLPSAREDGLGADAGRPGGDITLAAIGVAAVIALVNVGFLNGLYSLAGAAVGAGAVAMVARRRLGGQTGDVLGAVQIVAELSCLLLLSLNN